MAEHAHYRARNQLTSLPEQFAREPEPEAVEVTRRGTPVLAILPWDLYETILFRYWTPSATRLDDRRRRRAFGRPTPVPLYPGETVKKTLHL